MKYYRVKQPTFLWHAGAILHNDGYKGSYVAVEDVWNKVPLGTEYISAGIVEHPDNADFFERVYQDTLAGKLFKTKDQVLQAYGDAWKAVKEEMKK